MRNAHEAGQEEASERKGLVHTGQGGVSGPVDGGVAVAESIAATEFVAGSSGCTSCSVGWPAASRRGDWR